MSSCSVIPSFGDSYTPLIISYLVEKTAEGDEVPKLHAAISPIWERLLNEPDHYVNTLLHDKVIDFPRIMTTPSIKNLFLKHIYPSLVQIAASPSEKALLASVVGHLKANHLFLSIIPENKDKESSCAYFSLQGLRVGRVYSDSCTIVMQYAEDVIRVLSDKDHTWHLGTTDKHSTLLHELAHLDNMLQVDHYSLLAALQTSSWRWTNQEEQRVIDVENCALEARGALKRLGHKVLPFTNREFANMPATLKLAYALAMGADATVKELCDRHLAAPEGSEDRIIFNSQEHASPYASAYLIDHPDDEDLIDKVVDGEFQQATRAHKNLALTHLLMMLNKTEDGMDLIKALLESIVTKAPTQGRADVIPFVQGIGNALGIEMDPATV